MTKEEVLDLISDAGFGTLATMDGDQPRVRPMVPYLTEENKLLIALLPTSRSIEQVKKNSKVEICFVDRKMWFARVTGNAAMSDDLPSKQDIFENVPMLRQYFSSPEDPILNLMIVEIASVEASTPHQKAPEIIALD